MTTTARPKSLADIARQAREREAADLRKAQARAVFQARFNAFVGQLVMMPVVAYVLMLSAGAAHGLADVVPAFGYGTSLLLILGADALSDIAKKFRK